MIDLYVSYTSNAQRASIAVLEAELPHTLHHVSIAEGEHRAPEFLAVNPNGQLPAMVDRDGPGGEPLTLTQSVGIAWYLAEKGGVLIPDDPAQRAQAMEWSLFMATDAYPPFAMQYYVRWAGLEDAEPMTELLDGMMARRFGRMDAHLADNRFLLGDDYSIADLVAYPMTHMAAAGFEPIAGLAHIGRWLDEVATRPAVAEAMSWFTEVAPKLDTAPNAARMRPGD